MACDYDCLSVFGVDAAYIGKLSARDAGADLAVGKS